MYFASEGQITKGRSKGWDYQGVHQSGGHITAVADVSLLLLLSLLLLE